MDEFFDDFIHKAKSAADVATKKTGEIYELSKYKFECIKINSDIKSMNEKLGGAVYSMKKGGYDNQELIDNIVSDIDEKLERLNVLNDKISELKNTVVCSACKTRNPKDSIYCKHCGNKLKSEF